MEFYQMKIEVDILDLGPDLATTNLSTLFEAGIKSRFKIWKKSYGLKKGLSLMNELPKFQNVFDRTLREFVARSSDVRCGDVFSRSSDIRGVEISVGDFPFSHHRYLAILLSVCTELEKGFNSYPKGWGPISTDFSIRSKLNVTGISIILVKSLLNFFEHLNEQQLSSEVLAILENLNVQCEIQFKATTIVEKQFTPEFEVSVTNEKHGP
jgi:hypothetical protein